MAAAEEREKQLQQQLYDAKAQHEQALEDLRQELEHEAQVERESLQSEFQVQLQVELRKQAAELTPVEDTTDFDDFSAPDQPHSITEMLGILTTAREHGAGSDSGQDSEVTTSPPQSRSRTSPDGGPLVPLVDKDKLLSSPDSAPVSPSTASTSAASPASSPTPAPNTQAVVTELRTDFDRRVSELCQKFEAERSQLKEEYETTVSDLKSRLQEAEEKYNALLQGRISL